jgi:hypothetical protein
MMPEKLTKDEIIARQEQYYEWIAYYDDGTFLKQYDDENKLVYHFGFVNLDKIIAFELIPKNNKLLPIKIDLKNYSFYVGNKLKKEIFTLKKVINLQSLIDAEIDQKAKLVFWRHVKKDFNQYGVTTSIIYELGFEFKTKTISIFIDKDGNLGVPETFEEQGFKQV